MYSFYSFVHCDTCGRNNHTTEQCRRQGKKPCAHCGRDNHATEDYTKRKKEGVTRTPREGDRDTPQTTVTRTRGGRGKSKAAEDRQRLACGHDRQVKKAIKQAKGAITAQAATFSDASKDEPSVTSEQPNLTYQGYALTIKLHGMTTRTERDPRIFYIDSLADHAFTTIRI